MFWLISYYSISYSWFLRRPRMADQREPNSLYTVFVCVKAEFWIYLLRSENFILTAIAATYANH